MSQGRQQNHFFVVRLPDGKFLTPYNSRGQAPKMYVRIGDARRWAQTFDGAEVLQVRFEQTDAECGYAGSVVWVPAEDDYQFRERSKGRGKRKTRAEAASDAFENMFFNNGKGAF